MDIKPFLLIISLLTFFAYFSMPISAYSIDDIGTLTLNGTATDLTFNGTNFWISDDLGGLYEYDINFTELKNCSVNQSAVNYVTYLFYDQNESGVYLYGGEYSGTTTFTLPQKYFIANCSIAETGTWWTTRLTTSDAWYWDTSNESNQGIWNIPFISWERYNIFRLNSTADNNYSAQKVYPSLAEASLAVTASKFKSSNLRPIDFFVIGNSTQDIHKYNAISDLIDLSLQYLIDISVSYPDIDRTMALEYMLNGSTKWLYMINDTHAWRLNISEYETTVGNSVDLIYPQHNAELVITEVTGEYELTLIDNITAKIYLDSNLQTTINYSDFESGTYYWALGNLSSGTHIWGVRISNQTNDNEIEYENATFTITLAVAQQIAEGVADSLGLEHVEGGLFIFAFLLIIAFSIGAVGMIHMTGGSGQIAGLAFLLVFISGTLVFGSIGWLPAWISIMIIIIGGVATAFIVKQTWGG